MTEAAKQAVAIAHADLGFASEMRPQLSAGRYRISARQSVEIDGISKDTFVRDQIIDIDGPRYRLDAKTVRAVYPPAGHAGNFTNSLPHIVLTLPTLPWQRSANSGAGGEPWLALLLFHECDPPPEPQTIAIEQLRARPAGPYRADTATAPPPEAKELVTIIDTPRSLFEEIAPRADELALLCHVRSVTVSRKAGADSEVPPTEYAVVVANRPPRPGRNIVHLVSLEGLAEYLPSDRNQGPPNGVMRLVSLHQWTFAVDDRDNSFQGVLAALSRGPLVLPQAADPSDPDGVDDLELAMLDLGYCPLTHRLRTGEPTLSWYRGPLQPSNRIAPDPKLPATTSDELLRLDSDVGMFDVSHASAWQLGRLTAMANLYYARALCRWKQAAIRRNVIAGQAVTIEQAVMGFGGESEHLTGAAKSIVGGLWTAIGGGLAPPEAGAAVSAVVSDDDYLSGGTDMAALRGWVRNTSASAFATHLSGDETLDLDETLIVNWLASLIALERVPFNYLVPHGGLCPAESFRFFRVDRGWIAALLDGALSLGDEPSGKWGRLARERLRDLGVANLAKSRAAFAEADGEPSGDLTDTAGTGGLPQLSGFILRSKAVAGWPGLEMRAWTASGKAMELVRAERLSDDLLLCIVRGVVRKIELIEPAEGLHFAPQPRGQNASLSWRTEDGRGVLDIGALSNQIAGGVSAKFAEAMARVGARITFEIG